MSKHGALKLVPIDLCENMRAHRRYVPLRLGPSFNPIRYHISSNVYHIEHVSNSIDLHLTLHVNIIKEQLHVYNIPPHFVKGFDLLVQAESFLESELIF